MIIEKLVYDVREILNQYSDDSEISDRYIIYLYGIKRAKYLRQELNNMNRVIDNSIQQTLCLKMEEVSSATCGVDLECDTILKSIQPLPKPLELHIKPAIISVRPTNKLGGSFNFITKARLEYIDGAAYPNSLYSFLDSDGHIYIYSKEEHFKNIECITINAVFEDPLELKSYKNCCDCDGAGSICYDEMKTDYPLQPHFIDLIKNEIIKDLSIKLQIPTDKTNDSINGQTANPQK